MSWGSVSSFHNLQFYDIFSPGMRLRVKEGIKKYMLNFFKKTSNSVIINHNKYYYYYYYYFAFILRLKVEAQVKIINFKGLY